jgi:hypothetical protein
MHVAEDHISRKERRRVSGWEQDTEEIREEPGEVRAEKRLGRKSEPLVDHLVHRGKR